MFSRAHEKTFAADNRDDADRSLLLLSSSYSIYHRVADVQQHSNYDPTGVQLTLLCRLTEELQLPQERSALICVICG
jgi:hypothetical protein